MERANPGRAQLEAGAVFAEKRLARALVKARAAKVELDEANGALGIAIERLTDWIAANPDPQLPLPLTAAPELHGDHQ
jgi:hypothetical protein